MLAPIKPAKKPRIGLYSIGLRAQWEQFPGLRERLIAYGQFIEQRLSSWADVLKPWEDSIVRKLEPSFM